MRYNEGPGVKLGDSLVLHPGLSIEGRYDSNVLFTNNQLQGAPYLRLLGHIDLATRSAQRLTDAETGEIARPKVEFRLRTAVGYREYFSGDDAIVNQRAVEIDAGLMAKFFPGRIVSFELEDTFARIVTARNFVVTPAAGLASLPSATIDNDINRLTGRFVLTPGGGRLSFALGYTLGLNIIENDGFNFANKIYHELGFLGKYLLLPKTALTLEVVQQFYDYLETSTNQVQSKPFRIYAGFLSGFTPKLQLLFKIGYGNGIYDSGASFNSVILKTEFGYSFMPGAKISLGFDRNFSDSIFGNYFSSNRAYAGYDHIIASRFLLHLVAAYTYRDFDGFEAEANVSALSQHLVTVGLGFDYQIKEWFYVGIGYDLQVQNIADGPTSPQFIGVVDFQRHQVFGKVGFSY